MPFLLEAMDWQWENCGVRGEHPDYDLLPSEYFRRQIYSCFWFETDAGPRGSLSADNILYSTDYPHATSMSPGPASTALPAGEFLRTHYGDVDEQVMRKVLFENAASLYGVEAPQPAGSGAR